MMPTDGYWEWRDGLKYVSTAANDKHRGRHAGAAGRGGAGAGTGGFNFQGKEVLLEMLKKQGIRVPGMPMPMPELNRKETTDLGEQKVTLEHVKKVALLQSEIHLTPEFNDLIQSPAFENFAHSLFHYFDEYFKIVEIDNQPRGMVAEMSASEKEAKEEASQALEIAERSLGFNYSILILGLELPSLHHMECGSSRVSALQRDKSLFERFYTFVTYLVWVCFKRRDITTIECEVGRILKSNYFNPFARPRVDANHTSFSDRAKMSETSYLRATAQANALRKDLIKKPPIMSIVRQKSPVVTSLLPSTKEQSLWLFNKLDAEVLRHKNTTETADDVILGKTKPVLKSYPIEQKVGIIGQSLHKFNSTTLMPIEPKKQEGDSLLGETANETGDNEKTDNDVTTLKNDPTVSVDKTASMASLS